MSTDRLAWRIVLRPEPNVDGGRELRLLLRTALRRHGLRCTALRELGNDAALLEQELQEDVANTHDRIDG